MPLFDYRCTSCENEVEMIQGHDVETVPCSKCGATSVRQISKPAWFRIKGYSEKNGYGTRLPQVPAEYKETSYN